MTGRGGGAPRPPSISASSFFVSAFDKLFDFLSACVFGLDAVCLSVRLSIPTIYLQLTLYNTHTHTDKHTLDQIL